MTMENSEHIVPASGHRAELLDRMLQTVKELPQIIELERSGVRDGNGYWSGSDALGGAASRACAETVLAIDVMLTPRSGRLAAYLYGVDDQGRSETGFLSCGGRAEHPPLPAQAQPWLGHWRR